MAEHKIVVIGASAGGVEACSSLIRCLPSDFDLPVLVVLHVPSYSNSVFPAILARAGALPARHAVDGEPMMGGHVYVAPPDQHLLVQNGHMHLSRTPEENRHRPAVDVLFRSAALSYGPGVVGVVLSGTRDDGAAGLGLIRQQGGITVVQDPNEAQFPGMPRSAINNNVVDHVLPIADIAALLTEVAAGQPLETGGPAMSGAYDHSHHGPNEELVGATAAESEQPSGLTCPDCRGSLSEVFEGNVLRFRCRIGHAYSLESLLAAQAEGVEAALWAAVVALEERSELALRVAEQAKKGGRRLTEQRFMKQSHAALARANIIRDLLSRIGPAVEPPDQSDDEPAS